MTDAFYTYDVIAKYIIAYCNDNEKEITNLVLQKILYYVQGYFLKKFKRPAFNSSINKWPYGPVVPDAYYDYCINGAYAIYIDKKDKENSLDAIKDKNHLTLLNYIVDYCIKMNVGDLIEKTHKEAPWVSSNMRSEISKQQIYDFFNKNNPLKIK